MAEDISVWRMLNTDSTEFPLPDEFVERARQIGIEIMDVPGHDPEAVAAYGDRCNGLFVYRLRVTDSLLAALPHCGLIARVGTGYDAIDVQAAKRRDVMVTYVPDFCSEELSDHVMASILGFARQFPFILDQAHKHRWLQAQEVPRPHRLKGRTLGILGFGNSGRLAAKKAHAFGMEVLVWTRTQRPEQLAATNARAASFEDVLGCDYVSLHLPLTAATQGLINAEALAKMKPRAVLVNIARGAIVDTEALVAALRAGQLAGAALDVVQPAPLPADHPLWSLPNVWITSHSAAFSEEGSEQVLATVFEDLSLLRAGRPPAHPVPELAG